MRRKSRDFDLTNAKAYCTSCSFTLCCKATTLRGTEAIPIRGVPLGSARRQLETRDIRKLHEEHTENSPESSRRTQLHPAAVVVSAFTVTHFLSSGAS